ncbi:MAG: DUF805 domain-containing protein [Opitutae bacterium]|jgi:uncharacterized membrane protein YhaH (DUF805 family)|nr:DUF805 domain-containing protein [Opitutae bacterium]MDG1301686.1 DUF805 domain-containing protein [Opitutae bacterium]
MSKAQVIDEIVCELLVGMRYQKNVFKFGKNEGRFLLRFGLYFKRLTLITFTTIMNNSFLSSEGTIGRFTFIISLVLLVAVAAGISYAADYYFTHPDYFMHGHFGTIGVFVAIVTSLICAMVGLMQMLKRLRDMGKGAYLTLLMLIPGVNALFLLYTCVAPAKSA